MGLFSDGTVIVIGAGASVPFGLPTGLSLIDDTVKVLSNEARLLSAFAKEDQTGFRRKLPHLSPIYYAWRQQGDPEAEISPAGAAEELEEQANWLDAQTSDTIDDVIRHNTSRSELLRVAIVFALFNATHQKSTSPQSGFANYKLKSFSARKLIDKQNREQRNWVHGLINLARAEILEWFPKDMAPPSPIQLISFNYDGILERILDEKWSSVESEFGPWHTYFTISHPHGVIPLNSDGISERDFPKYLSDNAKNISVVHDGASEVKESVQTDRDVARKWCRKADTIYAIGFAFANANIKLLALDDWLGIDPNRDGDPAERIFHYINYDGSSGLRARVERLCDDNRIILANEEDTAAPNRSNEMRPLPNEKLEISDALMGGFLGEMPS